MRLTGRYTYLGWGSVFALVAANTLMLRFNIYTPAWEPFIVMAVFGFGYGGMLTVTLVALIAAVDQSFQAVVTSASYAFRSTGSCIGITVASAVFQNLLQDGLWSRFGSEPDAAKIIGRLRDRLDEIDRDSI
ncbi:hypothetical protein KEM55_004934 [Ascosphaera atra]|nr:hypothetical protein KEM55_004934 [Ascosphaera atra]